jgi:hypothetical protein
MVTPNSMRRETLSDERQAGAFLFSTLSAHRDSDWQGLCRCTPWKLFGKKNGTMMVKVDVPSRVTSTHVFFFKLHGEERIMLSLHLLRFHFEILDY